MIYLLDFRAEDRGGAVKWPSLSIVGHGPQPSAMDRLVLEERATFLIHGFNVDRAKGIASLTTLARELSSEITGAMICVLWPGDSFFGPLGYSWEAADADDTADLLARFIMHVWPDSPGRERTPASFVAHSKGARVAMGAAKIWNTTTGRTPDRICLLAAAIDDTSLADADLYNAVTGISERVAVLSSTRDLVLKLAYPAGDLLQAFLFADDIAGCALGYRGPKPGRQGEKVPVSVHPVPINRQKDVGHGDYLPPSSNATPMNGKQQAAAAFVAAILAGESAPPY